MFNIPKGPLCQSCGMPLSEDSIKGNEKDGSLSEQYCTYCYQNGSFTATDITKEEMIKKVIAIAIDKLQMPPLQATFIANTVIPRLNRWKNS